MAEVMVRKVQSSNWVALGLLIVAIIALLGSLMGYLLNRSGTRHAEEKAERAIIAAERSAAGDHCSGTVSSGP